MIEGSRPSRRSPRMVGLARKRGAGAALAFALVAAVGAGCTSGNSSAADGALREVMGDQHAHSLKVDPGDPDGLLLGLHGGLYRSTDAGSSWSLVALDGDDAMNVVGAEQEAALWVAGHEVRSRDGGQSFEPVRPEGLPNLDLHGFAVREGKPSEIYAAAANEGLYRSRDGGDSFGLVSRAVGPSAFGLAVRSDGTLFVADPSQGFLISADGGRSFRRPLRGRGLVSVALEPGAGGSSSSEGNRASISRATVGADWHEVFTDAAVAAVAVAPSNARRAYALGSDGTLFVSQDGARTWSER